MCNIAAKHYVDFSDVTKPSDIYECQKIMVKHWRIRFIDFCNDWIQVLKMDYESMEG